jgi:hypothetical protein
MGSVEGIRMRARYYVGLAGVAGLLWSSIVPIAGQSSPAGPNLSPEVQRRQLELAVRAAAKLALKPKVTCGMTVIPADPTVDPKAIKPLPDQTTKHTLRQVPPGACRS